MSDCRATETGYLTRAHQPDCIDDTCQGCQPCSVDQHGNPTRHCTARWRCTNHVDYGELTCPECLGKTRRQVAGIVDQAAMLLEEATCSGVQSEAMNLAGPATDPIVRAWHHLNQVDAAYTAARAAGATPADAWTASRAVSANLPAEDPHHPLAVLGRWEMMLREHYDQDYSELPAITVTGAARYLAAILDRFAHDTAQDFPLFVREVAACHAHLEAVLANSRTPERGAPCPACGLKRLVKRYRNLVDDHGDVVVDEHGMALADDHWRCPACRTEWDDASYRLRVDAGYLAHADALTTTDLERHYGIPAGSVRAWASRGDVRRRGRDADGRQLFDVTDVLARRAKVSA